jgi:hypothetical protein
MSGSPPVATVELTYRFGSLGPKAEIPDGQKLALAVEVKSLLGLRTQHAAMLYSLNDNAILGHVAVVKRDGNGGFRQATASSGAVLPFRRHKEKTDLLK